MFVRVVLGVVLSFLIAFAAAAQPEAPSQQPAEEIEGGIPKYVKDETPEERLWRVGPEDPGLDPDPKKIFKRKGRSWTVERFERRWAAYDVPEGYVRPMANVNFAFEIYQQNDKYVWVWLPTVEELKASAEEAVKKNAQQESKLTPVQKAYLTKLSEEFTELTPPPSGSTVRFEDSSEGLPSQGSWRHGAAFADMNGDGHIDIIAPPERGTRSIRPVIFLGDGKGKWTPWAAAVWPYRMDYGTVVAEDFNGDGRPDVAIGMHLIGVRVLLNNGDGRFLDASEGMLDQFPTRRIAASDVDGDGDLDLLALYEGPSMGQSLSGASVRAYINEGKASKWRVVEASAGAARLSGDWMAVGRFNNDRFADFVTASNALHGVDTLFRSTGAAAWEKVDSQDGELVPFYSMYTAVTTGRFGSRRTDDAIVTYLRGWPQVFNDEVAAPELNSIVGVDRISFSGRQPARIPVMRFAGARPVSGIGAADFDGDGKLDILFTRYDPREVVLLLGDGKGGFRRAEVEGLTLLDNPNYDITVGDVNGDGRPDVLVMYESTSESPFGTQNGAVRLFLNRGVASPERRR